MLIDRFQRPHQHAGAGGIQGAGRFVREDERRRLDQRAGTGDTLLLAAGELPGVSGQQILDAHHLRDGENAPMDLIWRAHLHAQ